MTRRKRKYEDLATIAVGAWVVWAHPEIIDRASAALSGAVDALSAAAGKIAKV